MGFAEIVLSKDEVSALKALKKAADKGQNILVDAKNKAVIDRLVHFGFAEVQPCTKALPGGTLSFPLPKEARITDLGRDYLAYQGQKRTDNRKLRRHEMVLYFISATAASVLTLFIEHFPDIVRFLQSLFQGW